MIVKVGLTRFTASESIEFTYSYQNAETPCEPSKETVYCIHVLLLPPATGDSKYTQYAFMFQSSETCQACAVRVQLNAIYTQYHNVGESLWYYSNNITAAGERSYCVYVLCGLKGAVSH